MEYFHILTGHGGKQATKHLLCQRYIWRGINNDINQFLESCQVCQMNNTIKKDQSIWTSTSTYEDYKWQVDLIGPLPESDGKRYILTCVDTFTKYVSALALSTKRGTEMVQALRTIISQRNSKPQKMQSDNGLELYNSEVSHFAVNNQIQWKFSAVYSPQSNGCVKRFNGILFRKLKKLCNFYSENWSSMLQMAVQACNLSYSRAINTTPYHAFYGKEPEFSDSLDPNHLSIYENTDPDSNAKKIELHEKILAHSQKYKSKYAKEESFKSTNLAIGDKVLYSEPGIAKQKFDAEWQRLGTITDISGKACAVLLDGKVTWISKNHLKKFVQFRKGGMSDDY
jgi:hypothetical protein